MFPPSPNFQWFLQKSYKTGVPKMLGPRNVKALNLDMNIRHYHMRNQDGRGGTSFKCHFKTVLKTSSFQIVSIHFWKTDEFKNFPKVNQSFPNFFLWYTRVFFISSSISLIWYVIQLVHAHKKLDCSRFGSQYFDAKIFYSLYKKFIILHKSTQHIK